MVVIPLTPNASLCNTNTIRTTVVKRNVKLIIDDNVFEYRRRSAIGISPNKQIDVSPTVVVTAYV